MTHRRPEPNSRVPTQIRYPWRAVARTVIVSAIAILPILPDIARAAHINAVPAVIVFLSIAAAIQRIIAIPEVDRWLRNHAFLAAAPPGDPQGVQLDKILDERDNSGHQQE